MKVELDDDDLDRIERAARRGQAVTSGEVLKLVAEVRSARDDVLRDENAKLQETVRMLKRMLSEGQT